MTKLLQFTINIREFHHSPQSNETGKHDIRNSPAEGLCESEKCEDWLPCNG